MKINEITGYLETLAPLSYQESYDNSGLQLGEPGMEITGALLCIDITPDVVEEAVKHKINLIISHHPLFFSPIKNISGSGSVDRIIRSCIKREIAVYSAHTNLDAIVGGVNSMICRKLGLEGTRMLVPGEEKLRKLVFFVPDEHAEDVRTAIFEAGAGVIGEYDMCSFNVGGKGTFRGSENSNPFIGRKGSLHIENETRIETILPKAIESGVIAALLERHPYEEVAYDVYPLTNQYEKVGMGMIGDLPVAMEEEDFLTRLKEVFKSPLIRHTGFLGKKVRKIAVCGGSGSFLLGEAIVMNADVFVSGDFRYHQFFNADKQILVADIGHYESEQFTKEVFYESLMKKFPKFAVRLSEVNTNPINYF